MNNPTYILLKPLPDGSIPGDEYVKQGDLYRNRRLFKDNTSPVIEDIALFTWQVEGNPDWFSIQQPKEKLPKRIEVDEFAYRYNKNGFSLYEIITTDDIPEEKYEAVKQAIEKEINNERDPEGI